MLIILMAGDMFRMGSLKLFLFVDVFIYLILMYIQITLCMELVQVNACPKNQTLWDRRAANFHCARGKTAPYHCMRNIHWRFFEFCRQVEVFYSDLGCPVLVTGDSSVNITQMECVGVTGCPALGMKPVFSSRLYEYPACLNDDIHTDDSNVVTPEGEKKSLLLGKIDAAWMILVVGLATVIVICFTVGIIVQRVRIKNFENQLERAKYMTFIPTQGHHYDDVDTGTQGNVRNVRYENLVLDV